MGTPVTFPGDVIISGGLTVGSMALPAGSIGNSQIAALAGLDASKVVHRDWMEHELFGPATPVAALTKRIARMTANATLLSVSVEIEVQATGGDRTVDVDIKKSSGGGAFASILAAPIHLTNATAILTAVAGAFSNANLVAGDILEVTVAVAGIAANQAQGLGLTISLDRNPA